MTAASFREILLTMAEENDTLANQYEEGRNPENADVVQPKIIKHRTRADALRAGAAALPA